MEQLNTDSSESQFSVTSSNTSSEMACAFPAPPSLLPQVKLKRYRLPKNYVKSTTSKRQFTEEQRKILKAAYNTNYWPSLEFYKELASTANLTLHQVQVGRNNTNFYVKSILENVKILQLPFLVL